MQWQDIRKHYPRQWLLLEALKAHSEGDKRILDQLAVLETYTDSTSALQAYKTLHSEAPERELYVFHTSRDTLDVTERRWLGIRGLGSKQDPAIACLLSVKVQQLFLSCKPINIPRQNHEHRAC